MGEPNWKHRTLFHGDNLDFLRGMNSDTVDLIATDPPFNKDRDFHATPDSLAAGASFQDRWSWEKDVHEEWVDEITDDWPHVMYVIQGSRSSYGDDMGAFLCFMAVRLLAMKRVLKPTGSIYMHCDHAASHYLKELMDAIFGKKNFRNEIVWRYSWGYHTDTRWNRKHDILLFYTKGNTWTFNAKKVMEKREGEVLRRLDTGVASATMAADKSKTKDKTLKLPTDVWDVPTINAMAKERTGFPTQKPLELYERIVKASSNRGDIVLDPFCGCATTLVAAERLGRHWVGIDIWKHAHNLVIDRLKQEGLESPDGDKGGKLFTFGSIHYSKTPATRTDAGETTVPYLRVRLRTSQEPPGPKMSRQEVREVLLSKRGTVCEGCNRKFDDDRYLELDHNTPRSDGGVNHISNRILLCGPCNKLKSNTFTLSGLRRQNTKLGYLVK